MAHKTIKDDNNYKYNEYETHINKILKYKVINGQINQTNLINFELRKQVLSVLNVILLPIYYPNKKKIYKQINENKKINIELKREPIKTTINGWKPSIIKNNLIYNDENHNKISNDENNEINKKKIISILNKLTNENFNKMVEETLKLNYYDLYMIDIIFNKAINEPFYSELYASYCNSIIQHNTLLIPLFNELCIKHFSTKKHKNLCIFIGKLYNLNLINNINNYIDILIKDIFFSDEKENKELKISNEKNLEILCELIKTIKSNEFKDVIIHLNKIKKLFNSIRCEVLIEKISKI